MSLVIPTGYGQASIEMLNDGDPEPWFVTFGVDLSLVGGAYEDAAASIFSAFTATIGIQLTTATRFTACNLSVGQDGVDNLIVRYQPLAEVRGTATANMLPQNCAALYDKNTARAGRRGRGRMFIPNLLKEADVNNVGVLTGTLQGDLQLQANSFLALLQDEDPGLITPMVLLHNDSPTADTTPDPVISLVVQPRISTQRRRLR